MSTPPEEMHILFENGLFLGAFTELELAQRTQDARKRAGRSDVECRTYRLSGAEKQAWMQGYIEAQHNAARGVSLDAQEAWKAAKEESA